METITPPPKLSHLFTLHCAVDPPMEIGKGPYGRRRCVPIVSGSVSGPHFKGEVMPGGADFMYVLFQSPGLSPECELITHSISI
jgi:hypothetical protein